jgi:hypothetical protein
MSTPSSIDPLDEARPQRWRFAARVTLASLAVGAALLAVPAAAAAQTGPGGGGFPGAGGPFASGSVVSVSGSTVDVKPDANQSSDGDVTVTLTDTTKYEKSQDAATDAIKVGDCVRINGTGSVKKGIKAETVALSTASSDGCGAPGGIGSGAGPNGGFPGGGSGQTPPSFPSGNGNGQTPPSFPGGNGNGNGNGNGSRPRFNTGGMAFGTVKSVSGNDLVVKSTTFTIPKKQGAQPKTKKQDVKVTLSSSTKITETVAGAATDLAVGKCVTASGTGDSGAITADSVRISDPQSDGSCNAFGGPGGGPPPGSQPGGTTSTTGVST